MPAPLKDSTGRTRITPMRLGPETLSVIDRLRAEWGGITPASRAEVVRELVRRHEAAAKKSRKKS